MLIDYLRRWITWRFKTIKYAFWFSCDCFLSRCFFSDFVFLCLTDLINGSPGNGSYNRKRQCHRDWSYNSYYNRRKKRPTKTGLCSWSLISWFDMIFWLLRDVRFADNQLHGRASCWAWLLRRCVSSEFELLILFSSHFTMKLCLDQIFWFQAKCLETGETVAIKKVLQDRRYKNRELQTMRLLDHPNVVSLKHCFFSTTEKDELYLNLVLEYVPETVHRVIKHYNKLNQRMPLVYVKLYTYQIFRSLSYIHRCIGVCHRDIKPQNLLVNPHTHQVKLCDFGSAKVLVSFHEMSELKQRDSTVIYWWSMVVCWKQVKGEPNISYICSRYYRAPELIFGATEYTTAIDVWSAGCVLAELLLGQVKNFCQNLKSEHVCSVFKS